MIVRNGKVLWWTVKFREEITGTTIEFNKDKIPSYLGYAYTKPKYDLYVYYLKPFHLVARFLSWCKWEVMRKLYHNGIKAGYNGRKIEGYRVNFWQMLQFAMSGVFFYKSKDGWVEIDCIRDDYFNKWLKFKMGENKKIIKEWEKILEPLRKYLCVEKLK